MASLFVTLALTFASSVVPAAPPADPDGARKGIWGPPTAFADYRELGVDVLEQGLNWATVAPRRPASPRDPGDPAYRWPRDLDLAVRRAERAGIDVLVMVTRAPGWANGEREAHWAPRRARDYADFVEAASRRWPHVRYWAVWGEPSRPGNFAPLAAGDPAGPRAYARLLDAAYERVKRLDPGDLVVGGNTWTAGPVSPVAWLRAMRLPGGRRPRLDLYGHNPFTRREPRLADPPLVEGAVDFSSLDDFAAELDRAYPGREVPLFLLEFTVPTVRTATFNFAESDATAARWLRAALREARAWDRIHAIGWYRHRDGPAGDVNAGLGLVDRAGRRKPAWDAYRDG